MTTLYSEELAHISQQSCPSTKLSEHQCCTGPARPHARALCLCLKQDTSAAATGLRHISALVVSTANACSLKLTSACEESLPQGLAKFGNPGLPQLIPRSFVSTAGQKPTKNTGCPKNHLPTCFSANEILKNLKPTTAGIDTQSLAIFQ